MTYRDDRDADRARIDSLEADLAAANKRVAELEGRREQALVLAGGGALQQVGHKSAAKTWLGAPLRLELVKRFEGAFPTDRFEDVVERIRALLDDSGRTELLRSSMTWWSTQAAQNAGPSISVTVAIRDGQTTLTITDRLGMLAGAVFGGVGGGLGGGAIIGPVMASIAVPVLAPVFIIGWLGGVYSGTRWLFRRQARKRAVRLQQLFDALVEDVAAAIKPAP
jgi:hypothetical protein